MPLRYNSCGMIPIKLRLAGFLSYREPVELDFTSFELACISGSNGAGKSSLLDAITWALFGQARKRDEALVNLQSKSAEVALIFQYEGNIYRIQRSLTRGKSAMLEFQILSETEGEGEAVARSLTPAAAWRPLTERTTRDTQARIESVLRLDYETFVNASFFLQGKADQFTQQTAAKRKDLLGSILGLEIWETYKERTARRRKDLDGEVTEIDGRIAEIDAELTEEDQRKARLGELEARLKQLTSLRTAQETQLEQMKKITASLGEQRKLAEALAESVARSQTALAGIQARLDEKENERAAYADLIERAREVESAYKEWQGTVLQVQRLDIVAVQFREHDEQRQPMLREITAEQARLEEEQRGLEEQERTIGEQATAAQDLNDQIKIARTSLAEAEEKLAFRVRLEKTIQVERERQAELKAENERLKSEMEELKGRIERLKVADGATCPLCGQELSEAHRKSTLAGLEKEGKLKGDLYRANQADTKTLTEQITQREKESAGLGTADSERLNFSNAVTQLTERLEALQRQSNEWSKAGAKRLKEVIKLLEKETYAADARKQLARLDKELAKLGYDASAHDAARRAESEARGAEEEFHKLETARAVNKQIQGEIKSLQTDIAGRESEMAGQQKQYEAIMAGLAAAESQAPDLNEAEREVLNLREQENQTRDEVGAARQKVDVLSTLRTRKVTHAGQRDELQKQIARYKTLERAFGKDGVPALLIEQALPEIEAKANEILGRLSNDEMYVKFETLSPYKDKKREQEMRETLDIRISDGAGIRDYEMYSGGEALRVNFAIRLALSEVLAQRKGARLQTLVIDEGFGSQDAEGRQRLLQAINAVTRDFAKILVITHLEELKDAFPTRIEVEKGSTGSTIKVL
jgi:exonuclease SbcC